jgi:hypothetical protein
VANQFLNAQEYANVMLLLAKNQLVTGKLVKGTFRDQVTDENGLKINVKRPPRFARNDASAKSAALATQDIITGSIDIAVDQYAKVHVAVGDIEYVESYNALMRSEVMKSAASTLAHQIDAHLQRQVAKFFSYVGGSTPATDPDNFIQSPAAFNRVHTRLMNLGVPNTDLVSTVLFEDGENIRGSLIGGNIQNVNRDALNRIRIPILSEIDLYATQQCPAVTNGTRVAAGTTLINNGTLSVNYRDVKDTMVQTLTVDGQAAGATVRVGEILTIANVFAWDWRNNVQLPYLQQFTVLGGSSTASGSVPVGSPLNTPIVADAGGAMNLIVNPPLIVQGTNDGISTAANTAFATVNAAAVDNAVVTHLGPANLTRRLRGAWTRSAIQLVSARLHQPFTGESSYAVDPETGISIRYWRGSDIATGQHIHRWDCIYGAENMDPFMGALVAGTA